MPGIFFTSPLVKSATSGSAWTHVEAFFPLTQVFANVLLSAYSAQQPGSFSAFQLSSAEAYIVTSETKMGIAGGIAFPLSRDSTVFLTTDHLTFWLQVNNGSNANPPTYASAVGIIYDYAPAATFDFTEQVRRIDLAVFEEDGTVVGTHRSVRLKGGPDFDEEEVRERVLGQAQQGRDPGSLRLVSFDASGLPSGADVRVDPTSGRVEPLPADRDRLLHR